MNVVTATGSSAELGPLARIVLKYGEMIEARATAAGSAPADWAPVAELVAVSEFQRVGAYQEVMTWDEYVTFLSVWAGSTRFEATVFRITEVGRTVFQEIEERHYKGEDFIRKNVIAVFAFDAQNRIRRLDIYEQAKDTGRWIADAAHDALSPQAGA